MPDVRDRPTSEALTKRFKAARKDCLEASSRAPDFKPTIEIEVAIATDGHAKAVVKSDESVPPDPMFGACLVKKLVSATYPPPSREMKVTMRLGKKFEPPRPQ